MEGLVAIAVRTPGLVLLLAFCHAASAHPLFPAQLDEKEGQQYSQAVDDLRRCIARVDPAAISGLQEEANGVASQLRYLCFSGRREEAATLRGDFYRRVANLDTVKQVKACGDAIPPRFDAYMNTPLDLSQFSGDNPAHVCDHEILPVDQFNKHSH